MSAPTSGETRHWLVYAAIEVLGYWFLVLAGYLLFSVGTAWGWLAFVPAAAIVGYITATAYGGSDA